MQLIQWVIMVRLYETSPLRLLGLGPMFCSSEISPLILRSTWRAPFRAYTAWSLEIQHKRYHSSQPIRWTFERSYRLYNIVLALKPEQTPNLVLL